MDTCKLPNCPNKATRKGLCPMHYMRDYRRKHPPTQKDTLEPFVEALPHLLRQVGAIGYTASYENGTVTIRKLGTKMSVTWP